jgi:porphyrinogen peroxidase
VPVSTDASAVVAEPAQPARPAEPAEPQAVVAPLTKSAIFLVAVLGADSDLDAVRGLCADVSALVRAVGFRDLNGHLTCVTGIGAAAWDRLTGLPRPAGLHPFREIHAGPRHAIGTAGDLLFHIRATRMDLCFELAGQIMDRLGGLATIADEVHGFSYFDERDLLGFVDGTENPTGSAAVRAAIIGPEEPDYAGGSYVIVQKYLHDLDGWNALPVHEQELIIGRTKLADIELPEGIKPSRSHSSLTTIDQDGEEIKIVRDNMPFGQVGSAEFGTYFIGYARSPATTEQMLQNMFVGSPPGNYDRILDFSTPVTGLLFFVPSQDLLDGFDDLPGQDLNAAAGSDSPDQVIQPGSGPPVSAPPASDGSLMIGSLRGEAST